MSTGWLIMASSRIWPDRRGQVQVAACLLLLGLPSVAGAQNKRDFCVDRPGLGTPACTLDNDEFAIELGVVSWTLDRAAGSRTDTLVIGDMLLRHGLSENLEVQLGWRAYATNRVRSGGNVDSTGGPGDVLLAVRRNLKNPDGSGFSLAVMPYLSLPTGNSAIGVGDWGAGLLIPVSHELPAGFGISFTGNVEAAVDMDRDGRHLAYGAIVGLDVPLNRAVNAAVELSARRDDDPSGTTTGLLAGLSAGWAPDEALQLDAGAAVGLNRDSPDLQIYLGIARRF